MANGIHVEQAQNLSADRLTKPQVLESYSIALRSLQSSVANSDEQTFADAAVSLVKLHSEFGPGIKNELSEKNWQLLESFAGPLSSSYVKELNENDASKKFETLAGLLSKGTRAKNLERIIQALPTPSDQSRDLGLGKLATPLQQLATEQFMNGTQNIRSLQQLIRVVVPVDHRHRAEIRRDPSLGPVRDALINSFNEYLVELHEKGESDKVNRLFDSNAKAQFGSSFANLSHNHKLSIRDQTMLQVVFDKGMASTAIGKSMLNLRAISDSIAANVSNRTPQGDKTAGRRGTIELLGMYRMEMEKIGDPSDSIYKGDGSPALGGFLQNARKILGSLDQSDYINRKMTNRDYLPESNHFKRMVKPLFSADQAELLTGLPQHEQFKYAYFLEELSLNNAFLPMNR